MSAADVTPEIVEAEIVEARERVDADGPWANREYKVIAALAEERDRLCAELARLRSHPSSTHPAMYDPTLVQRFRFRGYAFDELNSIVTDHERSRPAPVAVEVPKLTKQQIAMAEACCDEDDYPPFEEWALNGKLGDLADIVATLYKARSNAIDSSRILKDVDALTRWTPVEECLPEDGESVGFIAKCAHDSWNHGRSMGGKFHRKSFDNGFGGFTTPGVEWGASHWCRLPPAPGSPCDEVQGWEARTSQVGSGRTHR